MRTNQNTSAVAAWLKSRVSNERATDVNGLSTDQSLGHVGNDIIALNIEFQLSTSNWPKAEFDTQLRKHQLRHTAYRYRRQISSFWFASYSGSHFRVLISFADLVVGAG